MTGNIFNLVKSKLEHLCLAGLFLVFTYSNLAQSNLIEITYPVPVNTTESHEYYFTPWATIIGFVFIGVSFGLLAIAKLMFDSTDQYMMNNRYDLVIFKPPTNKSILGPRRVYSNTAVNAHNLAAAAASGFDVTMLNSKNPYTSFLASLSAQNLDQ